MRHSVLLLGTFAFAACVAESPRPRPAWPAPAAAPDRSQDTLREIERQRRWEADALASRPAADELDAVRDGDPEAVSDTRKRFRRLVTAVERATWIRETVPEVLRASASPDRLLAAFDAAGRDRNDALSAADETARALATSPSGNAISLDELKRALQVSRLARESEQRLAGTLGRAARPGPSADPLQRLTTVPMPPQPPFVEATARYLAAHRGQDRAMDSWPPQLAEERGEIRAAAADLRAPQPEAADAGMGEPAAGLDDEDVEPIVPRLDAGTADAGSAAAAGGGTTAPGEAANTVQVSGDLRNLLSRRGPPLSIAQRPDGLTAFRYREQRPCGVDRCVVTVDYLFDSRGRLMRSQVVKP
ncbi:MAG: hypothetical protein ACJ79H_16545 [Myxococcales bacterium]